MTQPPSLITITGQQQQQQEPRRQQHQHQQSKLDNVFYKWWRGSSVSSSALVDDAQAVLQRPGVVIDGVHDLLVLRHALLLLGVERPLERRDLRQHDGLELVVVRVGAVRQRREVGAQLRHRGLPVPALVVHLLLQAEDVLTHTLQRLRLPLQAVHPLVVDARLALVHLGHHALRQVLDVHAPLLPLLPEPPVQLREGAAERVDGGAQAQLHLAHVRRHALFHRLELRRHLVLQRAVRLLPPPDLRLQVELQRLHLVIQRVAPPRLHLAPRRLLVLQVVVELRELLSHVREAARGAVARFLPEDVITLTTATSASAIPSDAMDAPHAMEVDNDNAPAGLGAEEAEGVIPHHGDAPESLARVLAAEERAATAATGTGGDVQPPPSVTELLLLAVHALLLETGLTPVEQEGGGGSGGRSYALPAGWRASAAATGSYRVRYTLEGLGDNGPGVACTVRAQAMGPGHLVVVGSLDDNTVSNGSDGKGKGAEGSSSNNNVSAVAAVHRLVIAAADHLDPPGASAGTSSVLTLARLRPLWARGKDALALRLKAALCEAGGLPPPPALLSLPDEIKLACLANLPAAALAAVSCVCAELRYLAAADDLWRPLYAAEFGAGAGAGAASTSSTSTSTATATVTATNGYGHGGGFARMYARKMRERRAVAAAQRLWEEEQRRRAAIMQQMLQQQPPAPRNP
eukprot:CAMPEP_0197577482 /NCGR_PEP_ID=MMETSP1326-20131121/2094_1 /TAXON_ID=1155430 /ORGANISM="Genus nov. species nov., Strain RCC2288" /LENGTH=689 /DNA_ID=CAMNT_0043140561 /DNA_START=63 /DNA_END=2129 /DNA_ORIENTATION=+